MAGMQSKLFSLCLVDRVSLFLPGKSQMRLPLPKPSELGVVVTKKGRQGECSSPGLAPCLAKSRRLPDKGLCKQ